MARIPISISQGTAPYLVKVTQTGFTTDLCQDVDGQPCNGVSSNGANKQVKFSALQNSTLTNYTVTVTDANGCARTGTFSLKCDLPSTMNVGKSCGSGAGTGTISVAISSGNYETGRYVIQLEQLSVNNLYVLVSGSQTAITGSGLTKNYTSLANGTYQVAIKDTVLNTTVSVSTSQVINCITPSALTVGGTCQDNTFYFTVTGATQGLTVEYRAIGITDWTTSAGPHTIGFDINSSPYILQARYVNNPSSEVTASYDAIEHCISFTPTITVGNCTGGAGTGVISAVVASGSFANIYALKLLKLNGSGEYVAVNGQADKNINPGTGLTGSAANWTGLADGSYKVVLYRRAIQGSSIPGADIEEYATVTVNCGSSCNLSISVDVSGTSC
mgnify:CR=1 FL=1